jgi:hypothetical protein
LACGGAEGDVVVDDEDTLTHGLIVPGAAVLRSVASSTLSAALAWGYAGCPMSLSILDRVDRVEFLQ